MSSADDRPLKAMPDHGAALGVDDVGTMLSLSERDRDRLRRYDSLLMKWQPSINLIAASTVADRWRRHFLDSAQLSPRLQSAGHRQDAVILDIGSGAGFPGLVLAALGWQSVHSVEAVAKKAVFQREVTRRLGLSIHIHQQRIEDMSPFPVDIILARACAHVTQLLQWGQGFCHPETEVWLLKTQYVEDELTDASRYWHMERQIMPSLSDPRGRIVRLSRLTGV